MSSSNSRTVFVLSLGGFQFGYNTALISGALLFVSRHFSLSLAAQGAAVSILLLAALLGSALAGTLADHLGRRSTMWVATGLFCAGALLAGTGNDFPLFLSGRFLSGLAVGLVSVVSPMYIAEISPPDIRGRSVSVNQLAVTVGILAAYGCNYLFAPNWKLMFLSAVLPALLQAVLLFTIRESAFMRRVGFSWRDLPRKPLWIGIGLMVFQQAAGINSVVYFAPKIFEEAGFALDSGAILATMGVGAINVLATIVSLYLVDKWGRRPLLLCSLAGMIVGLLTMALALYTNIPFIDKISMLTLMGYVAFFAIGLGPLPALIISELFPTETRGQAMSLCTLLNWLFNFIVVASFLNLQRAITAAGAFCLYAVFAVLALALFFRSLPETKNVALK